MPPPNSVEALAKANEKRIGALERKADSIEKEVRKTSVDALMKKVDALTTIVKAQDAQIKLLTTGAASVDAKALERRLAAQEKKIDDARSATHGAMSDKDAEAAMKHIAKLQKSEELLKSTLSAIAAKQKEEDAAIVAEMKKQADKTAKDAMKFVEKSVLDVRIKQLEAMVQAAMNTAQAAAARR